MAAVLSLRLGLADRRCRSSRGGNVFGATIAVELRVGVCANASVKARLKARLEAVGVEQGVEAYIK